MNTFLVHPDEGGPHPVMMFTMDAPGKREVLHDMARRLAAVGYFVVLPNLYYRRERDFWLTERTEAAMAHMFTLMDSLNAATAICDTCAMLRLIDTLTLMRVESVPWVTVGAADIDPTRSSGMPINPPCDGTK